MWILDALFTIQKDNAMIYLVFTCKKGVISTSFYKDILEW